MKKVGEFANCLFQRIKKEGAIKPPLLEHIWSLSDGKVTDTQILSNTEQVLSSCKQLYVP